MSFPIKNNIFILSLDYNVSQTTIRLLNIGLLVDSRWIEDTSDLICNYKQSSDTQGMDEDIKEPWFNQYIHIEQWPKVDPLVIKRNLASEVSYCILKHNK